MSSILRPTHLLGLALLTLALSALPAWPQPAPPGPPAATPSELPAQTASPEPPRIAITLDDRTLFFLSGSHRTLPLEQRARLINERLLAAARDPRFHPEDIGVNPGEFGLEIGAPNFPLLVVFGLDAQGSGRPPAELAEEWAQRIRQAIIAYREARSVRSMLVTAAEVVLATVLFAALLMVVGRLQRRLTALEIGPAVVSRLRHLRIGPVRVQSTEHRTDDQITEVWRASLRVLRLALVILLGYVYLQTVLTLLPWSYPYARLVLDNVLGPLRAFTQAAWEYAPNLAFLAVLAVLTRFGLRLVRLFFQGIERGIIAIPGFYPDWANPTFQIIRLLLVAFAVVVAFPYLPGSSSPAFQGVSIFLGLLVSLGSTSAVANVVAGIILTYMRAFAFGDFVRIGDSTGEVVEKGLLVTRIRTVKNERIAIPNSLVLSNHVTNYSALARAGGLVLHTTVTIGYNAPWRTVHELLIQAALDTENILKTPPPFVLQTALNDFYVTYELNARTDQPRLMPQIYSDLHRNIQDRFNEAGVEIMSPHYTQLRDGNPTTIPESYLAKDYTPPAHRVQPVRPPRPDAP